MAEHTCQCGLRETASPCPCHKESMTGALSERDLWINPGFYLGTTTPFEETHEK